MDRGFTIDSGEMTPKLSLRRLEIQKNCQPIIEAMYGTSVAAKTWYGRIAAYLRTWRT